MARLSKEFTPDLLAKFLRSRKSSALAQIAADYVEDHPNTECVQQALVYFHDKFCLLFTSRMRDYALISFVPIHQRTILWNEWAGLGVAYILGDISLVCTMKFGNQEGLCNVPFTWMSLIESNKQQLEAVCRNVVNKVAKWIVPGILYRLKKR